MTRPPLTDERLEHLTSRYSPISHEEVLSLIAEVQAARRRSPDLAAVEALVDAVRATSLRFADEGTMESAKEGDAAKAALMDAIRELAAAFEEAARIADAEAEAYLASARKCDAGGNPHGGTVDTSAALACQIVAKRIRALTGTAADEGER